MTHRLISIYVKNYCNRTLIVKIIIENVVTCFFGGTHCRDVCVLHASVYCEPGIRRVWFGQDQWTQSTLRWTGFTVLLRTSNIVEKCQSSFDCEVYCAVLLRKRVDKFIVSFMEVNRSKRPSCVRANWQSGTSTWIVRDRSSIIMTNYHNHVVSPHCYPHLFMNAERDWYSSSVRPSVCHTHTLHGMGMCQKG